MVMALLRQSLIVLSGSKNAPDADPKDASDADPKDASDADPEFSSECLSIPKSDPFPYMYRDCYNVYDVEEALSFYSAAFGAYEFCFKGIIKNIKYTKEISLFGQCLLLKEVPDRKYVRRYTGYWRVDDLDATITRAIRAGAVFCKKICLIPIFNWRIGSVRDPFGCVWNFYEPVGKKNCGGLKVLLREPAKETNITVCGISMNWLEKNCCRSY